MRGRTRPRLALAKRLAFWLACVVIASGCAGTTQVVSDCPAPNIDEQADLENLLNWEPDRPASLYIARVLGQVYEIELREVRGE